MFATSSMLCKNVLSYISKIQRINKIVSSCKYCYSTVPNYNLSLEIRGVSLVRYVDRICREYQEIKETSSAKDRLQELQPVINILAERSKIVEDIGNLKDLLLGNDPGIKKLAEEEKVSFEHKISQLDEELLETILPADKHDVCTSIVLEVNQGVGGQESMLFARELFDMYCKFAEYKGWEVQIVQYDSTPQGGIRHGSALISGDLVFRYFKHEAGVHRVQRTPVTEKSGRIHTSTISVIALPQPSEIEVHIDNADLKFETKRASGAGGQHVNTTDSAVRIVHVPTGISVDCQVDRSQIKNRRIALIKLRALLYQKQLDSQMAESQATRKSQVKSNFRNEKIRTYNFSQDRITDHRLQGESVHNLKGFLSEGGEALEKLINKLDEQQKIETLLSIVNNESS